jgi:hypothetical protein
MGAFFLFVVYCMLIRSRVVRCALALRKAKGVELMKVV